MKAKKWILVAICLMFAIALSGCGATFEQAIDSILHTFNTEVVAMQNVVMDATQDINTTGNAATNSFNALIGYFASALGLGA